MEILEILDKLEINYELLEHEAVYTVEEAKQLENMVEGVGCKNLFLKDKKGSYFLLVIEENKKANLKDLAQKLDVAKLSFGSAEELNDLLGLEPGSVTPLSIINDKDNKVVIVIDEYLKDKKILAHPNVNTKTVSLDCSDVIKLIDYTNHKYILYKE